MKILKRIYILLLSAVLIIGGSGCELNNSEIVKEEQAAHDEWLRWRKEFLAEQELPTEYSQLSDSQKTSVKAIYEMIMYLQDKYGIEFEYTGYVRPQILEDEYLTAIPKGGNEKTDTVTVTRQDDGTLTDDYPNIAVRPYYEQMITDYIEDYFGSDQFKVYATVSSSTMQSIIDNSESIKVNDIGTSTVIFIDNDICSKHEINQLTNSLGNWLQNNKIFGVIQLILLNKDTEVINLCRDNYSKLLSKQEYVIRLRCIIQEGREIKILGGE